MCNLYERRIHWRDYAEIMERLNWPAAGSPADLPEAAEMRISDTAPVISASGNSIALQPMRWAFPAPGPRASPVFNFRSDGRCFGDSNRCLIPASAFFDFTGTRPPKTKHCFTVADAPVFAIAGIWRTINDAPHFSMLTAEPGPDVAPTTIARWSCCGPATGRHGSISAGDVGGQIVWKRIVGAINELQRQERRPAETAH